MFFENLCVFDILELPAALAPGNENDLERALEAFQFQSIGAAEPYTQGWVPPLPDASELTYTVHGQTLFCLQRESKVLPASVIRRAVEAQTAEIEDREYRRLGRRERARLKEAVVLELLPKTFTKLERTYAYIDRRSKRLIVDAANWRPAEELSELLRAAFGSLNIRPLQTPQNPQVAMTEWLRTHTTPPCVDFGDKVVLEGSSSQGGEARVSKQDVDSEDVLAHIRAGKRVRRLGLQTGTRANWASFTLDADLSLKGLKFDYPMNDGEYEDAASRYAADFVFMAGEVRALLARVTSWFSDEETLGL